MTRNKQIIGWMLIVNEQLSKLNLGFSEEPRIMLISDAVPE